MGPGLFGNRYIGMRSPAWHVLGTTVYGEQISAGEAIKRAEIDFVYRSTPIGYTLPDGTFIEADDRVAVLREPTKDDPTWRRLGIVSKGYQYLQNEELATGLDTIAEKTGWTFETAGALGNGETVFITLNAGSRTVFGDELQQYFIVSDGKVAGRALQVTVAPVRVVCQNTLAAASSAAVTNVNISHNSQIANNYDFWLGLIGGLTSGQDKVFAQLEAMASVKISNGQARMIIEAAYPLPSKNAKARQAEALIDMEMSDELRESANAQLASGLESFEYWTRHAEKRREAAYELYEKFNDGAEQGGKMAKKVLAKVGETSYAALQAVTELVDWGGNGSNVSHARTAIFGDGLKIKTRAWAAALRVGMLEA